MSIYRRVLKYYRGFLARSLIALAFSFAAIGLNLLKPWPFKIIVDQILPGRAKAFQFNLYPFTGGEIKTPVFDSAQAIALLCLANTEERPLRGPAQAPPVPSREAAPIAAE